MLGLDSSTRGWTPVAPPKAPAMPLALVAVVPISVVCSAGDIGDIGDRGDIGDETGGMAGIDADGDMPNAEASPPEPDGGVETGAWPGIATSVSGTITSAVVPPSM